jgi:hypothetical protein
MKVFGSGEKVILSVEDDPAAYLLLEIGFAEVGGDLRLYRIEDGAERWISCSDQDGMRMRRSRI